MHALTEPPTKPTEPRTEGPGDPDTSRHRSSFYGCIFAIAVTTVHIATHPGNYNGIMLGCVIAAGFYGVLKIPIGLDHILKFFLCAQWLGVAAQAATKNAEIRKIAVVLWILLLLTAFMLFVEPVWESRMLKHNISVFVVCSLLSAIAARAIQFYGPAPPVVGIWALVGLFAWSLLNLWSWAHPRTNEPQERDTMDRGTPFYACIFIIAFMIVEITFNPANYDILLGWTIAGCFYGVLGIPIKIASIFVFFPCAHAFAAGLRATMDAENDKSLLLSLGLLGGSLLALLGFFKSVWGPHMREHIFEIFGCGGLCAVVAILVQLCGSWVFGLPGAVIGLLLGFLVWDPEFSLNDLGVISGIIRIVVWLVGWGTVLYSLWQFIIFLL
jgi:hypothetical protein